MCHSHHGAQTYVSHISGSNDPVKGCLFTYLSFAGSYPRFKSGGSRVCRIVPIRYERKTLRFIFNLSPGGGGEHEQQQQRHHLSCGDGQRCHSV
jgi:hypothetical protein